MKSEDAKKIKCDRCSVVVGLHRHNSGWRCPRCIWIERVMLIQQSQLLLREAKRRSRGRDKARVISCGDMKDLAEVVKEVVA